MGGDLMDALLNQNDDINFEEDYIFRSCRSVTSAPDISLTELVANSWDAGALNVKIIIPSETGELIEIEDDGIGMNDLEFHQRWMTLNYDRIKRQGNDVIFPDGSLSSKRIAYGRNGIGRHGMFCFSKNFTIETWKNGECNKYVIAASAGKSPFKIIKHSRFAKNGNGTKLYTFVERNLPIASEMIDIISARFLYDPQFKVVINDRCVELSNHKGVFEETVLVLENGVKLNLTIVDSTKSAKKSSQHGVAFWVGGRLVGKPSWSYGDFQFLDGRVKIAKRYTIVVQSDDLWDEILPDWTGFIGTLGIKQIFAELKKYIDDFIAKVMVNHISDIQLSVIEDTRDQLEELHISEKRELSSFIEQVTTKNPLVSQEYLKTAVEAVISLEKSRRGEHLLNQLCNMSPDDIDKLADMLDNWNINDVLAILSEIDKRITVIEAINRIHNDKNTDELHTLHPLILNARWLFGAEFDSPMFVSNVTLSSVIKSLFKDEDYDLDCLANPRRRPDIVVLKKFSIKGVCTDRIDLEAGGIMKPDQVLIIELKRGGFEINSDEVSQAEYYTRQIRKSAQLHKNATIRTYVVGSSIGDVDCHKQTESGIIDVVTYAHLIETSSQKLFRIREQLKEHYESMDDESIVEKALKLPYQMKMK